MIETFQSEWELARLLEVVERLKPKKILEIGTWHGGTLRHWLRLAGTVVVVDDELRKAEDWVRWSDGTGTELHLVKGRSQDDAIVERARELGPYDFCFIDGDHIYESVRADWDHFGPMARVVAFHDIYPRPAYGVSRLWAELTAAEGARYMTICENAVMPGAEGLCGTGVLWT